MRIYKIILVAFFTLGITIYAVEKEHSAQDAQKVFRLIDKIQVEQLQDYHGPLRSATVTENELNAYVAYRIESERENILKELSFKLFKDNKIEGKIFIDLRNQNIPKILRPEMNFYFSGKLEIKEGKVRLNPKLLFLENQPIKLEILDLVTFIASKIQKTEVTGLTDWYDLPMGIKDIRTQKGLAVFYY